MTRRHLYSLSKLQPDRQQEVAETITTQNLTAEQTDRLIARESPKVTPDRRARTRQERQRRFSTTQADVLVTFRHRTITTDDIRDVLREISEQLTTP